VGNGSNGPEDRSKKKNKGGTGTLSESLPAGYVPSYRRHPESETQPGEAGGGGGVNMSRKIGATFESRRSWTPCTRGGGGLKKGDIHE